MDIFRIIPLNGLGVSLSTFRMLLLRLNLRLTGITIDCEEKAHFGGKWPRQVCCEPLVLLSSLSAFLEVTRHYRTLPSYDSWLGLECRFVAS